jgi:hypothetical protein
MLIDFLRQAFVDRASAEASRPAPARTRRRPLAQQTFKHSSDA